MEEQTWNEKYWSPIWDGELFSVEVMDHSDGVVELMGWFLVRD